MPTADHVVLVEHYGRLLWTYQQDVRDFREGKRRGDTFFHRKVRGSRFHEVAERRANEAEAELAVILKEAEESGVSRHELVRWCRVEEGRIGYPATFLETLQRTKLPGSND